MSGRVRGALVAAARERLLQGAELSEEDVLAELGIVKTSDEMLLTLRFRGWTPVMEKDHLPSILAKNPFFKKEETAKYEMLHMEATTKKPVTQVCKDFSYTRKNYYDAKGPL